MRRKMLLIVLILLLGTVSISQVVTAKDVSAPYPVLRNPFVTDVDVLIDVGHGGIDSGTLYGNIYEKDINLEMAQLTYNLLREKGLTVLVNRMNDYALSEENGWLRARSRHLKDLAQRSHLANEIHPKVLISLHVNWSKNSSIRGPLVLFQKTAPSQRLAESIQRSLNNMYGTSTEAVLGKPYFLLKHVHVPAVIVEMGFISNSLDREQMMEPQKQKKLAEAIVTGVTNYLKD
ncbi:MULTISPECIES: N-acetylmuramoyl-L-alanine amidase family protein [unclassified Paenibacillus]|uniref:N-acetylmuramoyl-L-alanine amidase family protein n=1 Tax=unclassified Paenibacillus TaxID=185978 RepID=UPI00362F09B2